MSSIFSTYSSGENRVTASFLAVLRALSLDRMQRLLGSLLEQSEFELVHFENQLSKGAAGVPDAIIQSSIRLLVETKIVRGTVNLPQLQRHLQRLDGAFEQMAVLLVLTPDEHRPSEIDALGDSRVAWASFSLVDQAIDEILEDKYEVVSEREAYLLRELQGMLSAEGLLASPNDVVIVAARTAWQEYQELSAYICQPKRSFQQVERVGFYSKGNIYPLVPKILASYEEVEMQTGLYEGDLGTLVERLLASKARPKGGFFKVLLLSPPNSSETTVLPTAIRNDKMSKSGKPTAFTMGQRYASLADLLRARTTSDLD